MAPIQPAKEFKPKPDTAAPESDKNNLHAIRTWSDSSGKFSVEAEFVSYTAGKVKIRRKDGTVVELKLDRLSEEDQEWIKNRLKTR